MAAQYGGDGGGPPGRRRIGSRLAMRQLVRTAAVALAVAILAAACTGDEDRRERRSATGCVVSERRRGDVPIAMEGTGRDDVWVVGAHYEGGAAIPYARWWDGERWDAVPVEVVGDANAGFHDVVALSPDDAWTVGSLRAREPMAQRWDGAAWTSVPVPDLRFVESELMSVTAAGPDDVWAVGRGLSERRWRPLILRWDGRTWEQEDVPGVAADATLRGASAAAPDDAWAVGWTVGAGGRHRTLALHFDGSSWGIVATPNPGVGHHVLSSVAAVSPDEAWAVGWSIGPDGRDRPLVLRWDGGRWRPATVPTIGGRAQLIDVAARASGDVWVAGRVTDRTETFATLILHGNGAEWRRVPTPDVGADDDTLAAVAVGDGSVWVAGTAVDAEGGYSSLVLGGC
jgi:hypothetical protein